MTLPEKILVAAASFDCGTFSAEDLIVRCWEMFPNDFGLQAYARQYPDSNRVLSKIMGSDSPVRKNGWLTKVATKRYRITDAGRQYAAGLKSESDGAGTQRLADVPRSSAAVLRRLLSSRAYAKTVQGDTQLTFSDACEFWNISPRSNANQLAAKMAEVNAALDSAIAASINRTISIPNGDIANRDEFELLKHLSKSLAEQFARELEVIKSRVHERRH